MNDEHSSAQGHGAPKVSVTMCVYNGAAHIAEAVDSILAQDYADLELIIVDDGSTDATREILAGYTDPRLRWAGQAHRGIPIARNHALSLARGEYIAVLDADDIAHPARIRYQVAYLEKHPEVVVLGSAFEQVDLLLNRSRTIVNPQTNDEIRRTLVYSNPICHSSVMIRGSALKKSGPYDEAFRFLQDYDLWSRLAQHGQMANLPDVLVTRRYHRRSVSNDPSTELLRLSLFVRAGHAAVDRLNFPAYYRIFTWRALAIFVLSRLRDLVKMIAAKAWTRIKRG